MIFKETSLKGAFLIEPERRQDERGFFARIWCLREFETKGLPTNWVQCNISFNKMKGTLRGMHFQSFPFEEDRLVRCTMGAIYDVFIDLHPLSPTFLKWSSIELTADNRKMVFIPKGFAHGFQTLSDNTEVFYQMGEFYNPAQATGIRWNDPLFAIKWPIEPSIISARDQNFPDFDPNIWGSSK